MLMYIYFNLIFFKCFFLGLELHYRKELKLLLYSSFNWKSVIFYQIKAGIANIIPSFEWKNKQMDRFPAKLIFTNLKLFLATATHNFKWVQITGICLICDKTFAILMFKHALRSEKKWFDPPIKQTENDCSPNMQVAISFFKRYIYLLSLDSHTMTCNTDLKTELTIIFCHLKLDIALAIPIFK